MTTPFWCLFILIFLPYLLSSFGGYIRIKTFGHYDNKQPRTQAAALEGLGARAYAAQQNLWEAMPIFAISVFVAHLCQADIAQSALAAQLFIILRIAHAVAYLLDKDRLRSIAFALAYSCCIYLFVLAIRASA